jgi:hypothetical protein
MLKAMCFKEVQIFNQLNFILKCDNQDILIVIVVQI